LSREIVEVVKKSLDHHELLLNEFFRAKERSQEVVEVGGGFQQKCRGNKVANFVGNRLSA